MRKYGTRWNAKGIRPERLQLEWCSAAEAVKWTKVMHVVEDIRKTVTKYEIEETKKILSQI